MTTVKTRIHSLELLQAVLEKEQVHSSSPLRTVTVYGTIDEPRARLTDDGPITTYSWEHSLMAEYPNLKVECIGNIWR